MPSCATASRVRTPWRSSSARAWAWRRSVVVAAVRRGLAGFVGVIVADQRPAPGGLRRPERGQSTRASPARTSGATPGRPLPAERPQRGERVVRDLAGPDQIPQRIEHRPVRAATRCGVDLPVEARTTPREVLADAVVSLAARSLHAVGGVGRAEGVATGAEQGDPAVVAPQAPPPRPSRPRPSPRARRAGAAGSRARARGRTSRSSTDAGIATPAS